MGMQSLSSVLPSCFTTCFLGGLSWYPCLKGSTDQRVWVSILNCFLTYRCNKANTEEKSSIFWKAGTSGNVWVRFCSSFPRRIIGADSSKVYKRTYCLLALNFLICAVQQWWIIFWPLSSLLCSQWIMENKTERTGHTSKLIPQEVSTQKKKNTFFLLQGGKPPTYLNRKNKWEHLYMNSYSSRCNFKYCECILKRATAIASPDKL